MSQRQEVSHEFVGLIPDTLEEGIIYVSVRYATVVHLCLCGCGHEVVTPLSPTDWRLTFDGESISLRPSIGSWTLECRSHYWIRRNRVEWAATMSDVAILEGRRRSAAARSAREDESTARDPYPLRLTRLFWNWLTGSRR